MGDLDSFTAQYLPRAATEIENDLILNWYPGRIGSRIKRCDALLELGLGHGFTATWFGRYCSRHVIIEGSPKIIELFEGNHPDFSGTVVHDYFETFESSERFDCIVMGFILEHVDDPDLVLERYKKFLKPGGVMYVAVPNAKSLNRRLGLELGIIHDIYDLNPNDKALGHKRQFCRDLWRELLFRHGYAITYEEGMYLKPLPLGVLKTLPDFKANLEAMLRVGVDYPDLCVALLMEVKVP